MKHSLNCFIFFIIIIFMFHVFFYLALFVRIYVCVPYVCYHEGERFVAQNIYNLQRVLKLL